MFPREFRCLRCSRYKCPIDSSKSLVLNPSIWAETCSPPDRSLQKAAKIGNIATLSLFRRSTSVTCGPETAPVFGVACGVGDVLVALVATASFAMGEVVADVDTFVGPEDGLSVFDIETSWPLEDPAVDVSSPLESLSSEPSPLFAPFETQEFGNNGAFIRSSTSPAQKALIECSGVPPRQLFFKQHIPASIG